MLQELRVGERPTLLLVDDCVQERDFYEIALAPDFTILTASRGAHGIELATATHPDAVVLDVMMPGLDGWETCSRIKARAETADIPVVLLTGVNDADLSEHAAAVGASAVLNKPCSADRLKLVVLMAMVKSVSQRGAMRSKTVWGGGGNPHDRS
jgi:CheY-like chemotaxis protein